MTRPAPLEPPSLPTVPPTELAARQMLPPMEQLLSDHPKLPPFAKALATTAMEKAARQSEQGLPDPAKALGDLKTAFRNQLHQWFLPQEQPATPNPLTAAV